MLTAADIVLLATIAAALIVMEIAAWLWLFRRSRRVRIEPMGAEYDRIWAECREYDAMKAEHEAADRVARRTAHRVRP